jgi:chromosomal replication initiator protein
MRDWLMMAPLSGDDVLDIVARYYGVLPADLMANRRPAELVSARQLAMWLCSKLLGWSSVRIGRALNRDHTTVLHGIRRIDDRLNGRNPNDVWVEILKFQHDHGSF